jgi:UDP-N-acetylglucosamine 2-epimerase
VFDERLPSAVVVQGDTTSSLAGAIAGFHRRVPVAHVEAGLRSYDLALPHPEEWNRRTISLIARWHFCPTPQAAANLDREGITSGVYVTGNTVVDAVKHIVRLDGKLDGEIADFIGERQYILATAHRRESWSGGIRNIAVALDTVLAELTDLQLIFVGHPNPRARQPAIDVLGEHPRVRLLDALEYDQFLLLLNGALLAVSDSGGIQEEGPTLGVPVVVTRSVTERPEGLQAGAALLVGTDPEQIRATVVAIASSAARREEMASAGRNLYGDGRAADRIAHVLLTDLRDGS